MKYLVDANVVSELTKPSPDPRVVDWLRTHAPEIAIEPVILGELRFGILILPQTPRVHAIASLRERGAEVVWFQTSAGQASPHFFAKLRKALLLGQED